MYAGLGQWPWQKHSPPPLRLLFLEEKTNICELCSLLEEAIPFPARNLFRVYLSMLLF